MGMLAWSKRARRAWSIPARIATPAEGRTEPAWTRNSGGWKLSGNAKVRNLLTTVPWRLHDELPADYHAIVGAADGIPAQRAYTTFVKKWSRALAFDNENGIITVEVGIAVARPSGDDLAVFRQGLPTQR